MTANKDGDTCLSCRALFELYERTPKSDRDYWLMTELFCDLHDGKDYCPDPAKTTKKLRYRLRSGWLQFVFRSLALILFGVAGYSASWASVGGEFIYFAAIGGIVGAFLLLVSFKLHRPDPDKNPAEVALPIHNVSVVPGACSECGGTGKKVVIDEMEVNVPQYRNFSTYTCHSCHGSGRKS